MDLTHLRADTPGCTHRVHLNNAGASLMPSSVLRAIVEHLELETRVGGYEAAAEAAPSIEAAYGAVADLLATASGNVAFTEHATAAFVQALSSVPLQKGDLILTTRQDYVSNQIQYLSLADRLGIQVLRAPDAPEGGVDLQAMEELIHRRRPRIVAVTHVPTNSGLVQDVEAIGKMCRARDILYLVDACQSVGQMPVHPEALGCDFLSATARKFLRGPRGAGFLWVSDRALAAGLSPLFPDLRGADWVDGDLFQPAPDARRFETWEFAWGLILGTGEAARYAMQVGLDEIRQRTRSMAASLRERLGDVPGVRVLDRGPELCAIVTASVQGWAPADLVSALRERSINTSAQTRLDAVLDYDAKGVEGALRISPHYFNTDADLDALLQALTELSRT
ncbi:MAG: aminotransferase class V-fold PLP-dependent enzyme [Longimicrobiales bacterium]|nr:aminotransferase class V-fold PLP-dependent enzyme [Longimicrobiales bacterium]